MITIPRFEKKEIKKSGVISSDSGTGILIKDHLTDDIIGYINLTNKQDENKELADLIIATIEQYIDEHEN